MTKKIQRPQINSTSVIKLNYENAEKVPDWPEGVVLTTQEEATLWEQYTSGRALEDWMDYELLSVHKIIKMELTIRECYKEIEAKGPGVAKDTSPRGIVTVSALYDVIDKIQKLQLSIMRALSLKCAIDSRTLTSKAGAANKARRQVKSAKKTATLFAMPGKA